MDIDKHISGLAEQYISDKILGNVKDITDRISRKFRTGKSSTRTKRKRSDTKGKSRVKVTGSFSGRVRAKKRGNKNKKKFYKKGFVVRQETGGRNFANEAIYVGHSVYSRRCTRRAVVGALLRQAFSKVGLTFSDPEDTFPVAGGIVFSHDSFSNSAVTFSPSTTFEALIDDCATALITKFNSAYDRKPDIVSVEVQLNTAGAGDRQTRYTMYCKQAKIHLVWKSYLKIQNYTLADDIDDAGGEDLNRNNIENNPLVGYLYSNTNKWKSYPVIKGVPLITNDQTGLVTWPVNGVNDEFAKPPRQPYLLGLSKKQRMTLEPGNIKYSKLKCEMMCFIDTLFAKDPYLFRTAASAHTEVDIGSYSLFGLEKAIDVFKGEGENRVSLGYQIDNIVMADVSLSAPYMRSQVHIET